MAIHAATHTGHVSVPARPLLSDWERQAAVRALLPKGDLTTPAITRRLQQLAVLYQGYVARYPFGSWAPGLLLTGEMHRQTALYLPLAAIWPAWRAVMAAAGEMAPVDDATAFCRTPSWLTQIERIDLPVPLAPHRLLGRLVRDEAFREQVLFAWQLPRQHGGGFDRYPEQLRWLAGWLKRQGRPGKLACLDAACGSGEGTYELASTLLQAGFDVGQIAVTGTTLQPLEVIAAALAHFPHDPRRQEQYRQRVSALLPTPALNRISFRQEDLLTASHDRERYGIILCNGLLGGPLLHDREAGLRVVRGLAVRLAAGGILLVADRFHDGWHCRVTRNELQGWLVAAGLQPLEVPDGLGGVLPQRC